MEIKKIFIIVILWSVGLVSCTSQKTEHSEKVAVINPIEIVKDSTCCFDIKKYNERKEKFGHYDFDFTENDKNIRQRYSLPDRNSPESEGEYVEEISIKWKPFVIRKGYDYKGRLRAWTQTFRLEPMNKSYEYDENGKIIKITNYEERFKHTFADIREFLLKEKRIDIYDTRQAIARRVNHSNEDPTQVYYDIHVLDNKNEENDYRIVIFDDTLELKEYH